MHVWNGLPRISPILHAELTGGRAVAAHDDDLYLAHGMPQLARLLRRQLGQRGDASPWDNEHVSGAQRLQVDGGDAEFCRKKDLGGIQVKAAEAKGLAGQWVRCVSCGGVVPKRLCGHLLGGTGPSLLIGRNMKRRRYRLCPLRRPGRDAVVHFVVALEIAGSARHDCSAEGRSWELGNAVAAGIASVPGSIAHYAPCTCTCGSSTGCPASLPS